MKKIIPFLSLAALLSCNEAPKCDNKEAIKLVTEVLEKNSNKLVHPNGSPINPDSKIRIKDTVRKSFDSKSNTCECEATVATENEQAKMSYSLKEDEGGVYVNVNKVSPFEAKP